MNDASHHSQREIDTLRTIELRETPARSCVVARAKLENIDLYLSQTQAAAGHESLLQDCLKRFYELAGPQLADQVIDARLFADGDATTMHDVLSAIDTELAAWQRYGIVASQVEPLVEFSASLTELEQAMLDDDDLEEGLRYRIEREIHGSHQTPSNAA